MFVSQLPDQAERTPSALMYSPDSIGLGHMRRNSAIAAGLSKLVPGISNLLLVGSSAGAYFDLPPGADCIKLPSILKTGQNEWTPKSLNVPRHVARSLRSGLIVETVEAFAPDVFLVDHVPSGLWDELIPALRRIKTAQNGTRVVLGLRDILGAPDDIRSRWEADSVYDLIDEYYDEILIYGDKDIYDAARQYGLADRFADRITYCGFIHFAGAPLTRAEARKRLELDDQLVVTMTAGGGHDAFPVMDFALRSLSGTSFAGKHFNIITGPLMPEKDRLKIVELATAIGATVIVSTPHVQTHLAASDVIVTMGGYNTMMEAAVTGVPTIVIPRTGPSAEQRIRAQLFQTKGLAEYIDLEYNTPADFLRAFAAATTETHRTATRLTFDGISNAAAALGEKVRAARMARINAGKVAA
jgi:predicted glycosyltransferase